MPPFHPPTPFLRSLRTAGMSALISLGRTDSTGRCEPTSTYPQRPKHSVVPLQRGALLLFFATSAV